MPESQTHRHGSALLLPLPQLISPRRGRKVAVAQPPGDQGLSLEQISNMLWAGFALHCHGSGGRAVFGRRGAREVEAYICLPDGCYRYDVCDHALVLVSPHDARGGITTRKPLSRSDVTLVYVTDGTDDADGWEETGHLAGADVATIAGNVAAYSTAAGLVARGEERFPQNLALLLGLHPKQRIALIQKIRAAPMTTH